MVGAGDPPRPIYRLRSYLFQQSRHILFVVINHPHLLLGALSQRSTRFAIYVKEMGQTPRVIKRLDCKQRHFDVLMQIFREHALPLLLGVGLHTLCSRWVDLQVGNLHEIDE